jgi:hypothetical protein
MTPEAKSYLRGKRYNLEKGTRGGEREASTENRYLEQTRERLASELGMALRGTHGQGLLYTGGELRRLAQRDRDACPYNP